MAKDLFVVIPTAGAGRPVLLRRTLDSLATCHLPVIYRETLVVENGPQTGAEAVVQACPAHLRARYIHVAQPNKSHALNMVLQRFGEGLIFFTDDDVRLHPYTLCAYAEAAKDTETGKFYGGPTGVDYEREPPQWLLQYLPSSARGWQLTSGVELTPQAGFFLGFNWAAFARDLREAGGFDVRRGPGATTGSVGQEAEMQRRLLKKGFQGIYVPEAMVWHYIPSERCSPDWAIHRGYRQGIARGMEFTDPVPTIAGFPRWMIREWIKRGWEVLKTSVKSKDLHTRFDAWYRFYFHSGYMKGCRIVRRSSSSHVL